MIINKERESTEGTCYMQIPVKHILIYGRVQGVGFRSFVEGVAARHKLEGWVRNLADGAVEILVHCTDQQAWGEFMRILHKGPPMAQVGQVKVQEFLLQKELNRFRIVPNGEAQWNGKIGS